MSLSNLRVFGVPWHMSHQHDLIINLPFIETYGLLRNPWRAWHLAVRPMPDKCVQCFHFDRKRFDVAILHVDNDFTCVEPKTALTRGMNAALPEDFPRVFINHGNTVEGKVIEAVKELVGEWPMVVNSEEAQRNWGSGTAIHHYINIGLCKYTLPKFPVALSFAKSAHLYDEGSFYAALRKHAANLELPVRDIGGRELPTADIHDLQEAYASHSTFVHASPGSPMPRSRTEAMLCGCQVVSTSDNDFKELFGHLPWVYISDDPEEQASILKEIIGNSPSLSDRQARRAQVGQILTLDNYQNKWTDLLTPLVRK